MKSLYLLALSFLTFACSPVRDGSTSAVASESQWNRTPISVRIPNRYLNLEKITFARVSSQSSDRDYPAPASQVRLKIEGDNLLLNDSSLPQAEIARWKITGKEKDNFLVTPPVPPSERYFHDVRSVNDGLWFHETIQVSAEPEKTWTIFLLATTGTSEFTTQSPVKEIGYMVNYRDSFNPQIYSDQEPFNPDKLFITKWHHQKTIEWVISPSVPREFIPFINEGITAWNEVLPKGLRLSTRIANSGEELDGPFTNAVVYQPTMSGDAAASFSFYPMSGEIFRATLIIGKLPPQVGEHGPKLRGSVSHEIGHTLGLRHNFKGSLYDQDLATDPTGSSIMEYPDQALDGQRKIGPYDRDAIRWAYADNSFTTKYPFCTDEMQGIDPLCQQNDPTSSAPFKILADRVRNLVTRQMDQTTDLANFAAGKSPFDRIGPYVQPPESAFYHADINAEINALFETFLENASVSPTPVGAQIAARHLQRIIDGATSLGLSESQLKTALPALDAFNTWKARHPSPATE